MSAKRLAPRTEVLKACDAGKVTGSGNVWATGWFNYRMVDDAGRERTVTAAVESLQHRGLVERAPKTWAPGEPKLFTAKVTDAGRAYLAAEAAARGHAEITINAGRKPQP